MRTFLNHVGLFGVTVATIVATPAIASDWKGSFIANGQCYCNGELDPQLSNLIVPTPIGGQSIQQVCSRIGEGPALSRLDGVFNYPVYADAQCGNGPFTTRGKQSNSQCVGSRNPGAGDCYPAGPHWDLTSAYAVKPVETPPAQITATVNSVDTEIASDERGKVTGGSRYITPRKAAVESASSSPSNSVSKLIAEQSVVERSTTIQALVPNTATSVAQSPPRVETLEELQARQKLLLEAARERLRKQEKQHVAEQRELDKESDIAEQQAQDKQRELAAEQEQAKQRELAAEQEQAKQRELAAEQEQAKQRELAAEQEQAKQRELAAEQEQAKQRELAAEQAQDKQRELAAEQDRETVQQTAQSVTENKGDPADAVVWSALRMPTATRASSRDFGYVDALPVSYDFGGTGVQVEGSAASHGRWQYLARAGVANTYQEVMLGAGFYVTPPDATRMTVIAVAGIEYGKFQLDEVDADFSDTGLYLSLASRFVVNNYVELQSGVSYSSFFEGDPALFGAGFYHINRQLDLTSRFEIGDNDSIGIGVRYYY